jgi:biotin carboxyl carrier protein
MIHKKTITLGVSFLLAAMIWVASAANLVDQVGALSGKVSTHNLVTVGTMVKEGMVLVTVDTITGPAPAVRANRDGVVREVLVKPGDGVRTGDVLARIEPATK